MIGVAFLSLLVGFSGAIIPGPMFAVTVQQALLVGWTAGFWIAVGHMLAELTLVVALRVGLGGVLTRPRVMRTVALVGGVVLLYLAWDMARLALRGELAHAAAVGGAMTIGTLIVQGAYLSVINATWHVWWGTVGVGLIAVQTAKHGTRAWPAFFAGHTLADFLWYTGVSALIAFGGRFFSEAVHRSLILGCGLFLALLGLAFITRPFFEGVTARRRRTEPEPEEKRREENGTE